MSKKISFACNEESVQLFLDILLKLDNARGDRKIRIGGSEFDFYADNFGHTPHCTDGRGPTPEQ